MFREVIYDRVLNYMNAEHAGAFLALHSLTTRHAFHSVMQNLHFRAIHAGQILHSSLDSCA